MSAMKQKTTSAKSTRTKSHAATTPVASATPVVPATIPTTAPAIALPSAPVTGHASPPAPPLSLTEVVAKAITLLDDLEASLNLDIAIPPNDVAQMRSLRRISDAALTLASNIVTEAPASFPAFAGLPDAAAYVQAMTPLAARVQTLATHVQNSVLNQRTPASTQTLALYGMAKNVGRLVGSQTMREHVAALKAEVAPKHKYPKPKLTKAEKAARRAEKSRVTRLANAAAVVAANGERVRAVPASPAAPATVAPVPPVSASPAVPAPAVSNGVAPVASPPPAPAAH